MNNSIATIMAREVLDSRGNPTLEVEVTTVGGASGRAMVPSGASTGIYEAVELRDGGSRYHGRGVLKAISSVESIAEKLMGMDVGDQESIDRLMIELDGTQNKARLGGNALLGVSMASAKAAAAAEGVRLYEHVGGSDAVLLPIPFFNVINGGQHAGNDLDFQEFMIAPLGAGSFSEALRIGSEIYHCLKGQLKDRHGDTAINVGDEGGFSPPLSRSEEALEAVSGAIEEMGYGGTVSLAMDVAASSFYADGCYTVAGENLDTGEMIDLYKGLVDAYPLVSIEDPLQEEDFEGFAEVTRRVPVQIVGDDLFVTTASRLRRGIELGACSALLWKVNQVGTLTESLEAADIASEHGYRVMASHRSGDTEDPFVADLAVAIGCGQIKTGAPARGERTAKYNRLLRIEDWLGERARYPSKLFD
ncbi:phosphopyruvate hydratase [Candidatus Bathyarchaeota archaeon]|nr:phosphopyruvate hydratase [Candidatus Bathyarchaeota archaeon]